MLDQLMQVVVKVIFTAVLCLVIGLCAVEIWRLWFDQTLVLIPFAYSRDGQPSREAGQHFTQLVSQDLNRLRDVYTGRLRSGDVHIPSTDHIGRGGDIQVPVLQESVLSSIEIQAYGVQVSNLLRSLSRWMEQPYAISGNVTESARGVDAYAELRRGRSALTLADGSGRWYMSNMADPAEASYALACRIFRLTLENQSPIYRQVSDAEFCAYTRALESYLLYQQRVAEIAGEEEARQILAESGRIVSELAGRNSRFPFVYKLAGYIHVEEGNLEKAETAFTKYLQMLDSYGETDSDAEQFLTVVRGDQPAGQEDVVSTAGELGLRGRVRPVQPGTSVSSRETTAGTICCVVRDAAGATYLLSADHVFRGGSGTPVYQPGGMDGGQAADQVAEVTRVTRLQANKANRAAGAIARLLPDVEASPELPGLGPIRGIAGPAQLGDTLRVVGRTSGLAEGTVTGLEAATRISTGDQAYLFEGLIVTTKLSAPGDSGAPVLTQDNKLVGFVYAGSAEATMVMPIQPVLEALEVELVQ